MTDATDTTPATRTIGGVELPAAGTWAIDVSHSSVNFKVKHLGVAKTRGRFTQFEGTVEVAEDPTASTVAVSIDTASVDTHDSGRDEHLRSADFFDVANHPQLTFRSTGVSGKGDSWTLDGDLTIAGVTKPVSLDVEFEGVATDPWGGSRAGFAAKTTVNREDFGLTWNTALEAGGFLVGKNVTIELEVELVKQ
ncbi:MAG: polyisoprenoid-binding protein [Actinomycetia bacterium]|nr:polyisoprenoid-binding protein [Actinomycetes bacterium]